MIPPCKRRRRVVRPTPAEVRRSLTRTQGNIQAAARVSGVNVDTFYASLREHGLANLPPSLRAMNELARKEATSRALVRNRGSLVGAARDLGINSSSVFSRVHDLDLVKLVERLRPQPVPAEEERRRILELIREHHGEVQVIAAALGVSRNTLRARMRRHDLERDAEAERINANLIGHRTLLGAKWNAAERRAKLVAILESVNWSVPRACVVAGISIGTMYTRFRELDIDPRAEPDREKLRKLTEALRLGRGIISQAAARLGLDARTVTRWMRDFDVDADDFR